MRLSARDLEQVEADLRLYSRLQETIDSLAKQAASLPTPSWSQDPGGSTSTRPVTDRTPRQARALCRDREYQRAKRLLATLDRLKGRLDARLLRVWDVCYQQGRPDDEAATLLGCSGRTVRRYRREIQGLAWKELGRAGVSPYKAS